MNKPEIIEKESMNIPQLKEALNKIKKRDEELSFRGNKTEEYVNEFAILKAKDAKELFDNIKKLNVPRLKKNHIDKLIDTLPRSVQEINLILQGYSLPINNDNLKKMMNAINKYATKKKK